MAKIALFASRSRRIEIDSAFGEVRWFRGDGMTATFGNGFVSFSPFISKLCERVEGRVCREEYTMSELH